MVVIKVAENFETHLSIGAVNDLEIIADDPPAIKSTPKLRRLPRPPSFAAAAIIPTDV